MSTFIFALTLLLTPFIFLPGFGWEGYAKELLFGVFSFVLFVAAVFRRKMFEIKVSDIFCLLLLVPMLLNPRAWNNDAYISIALLIAFWSITKLKWNKKSLLYILVGVVLFHVAYSFNWMFPFLSMQWVIENTGIMGIYISFAFPIALYVAINDKYWLLKVLFGIISGIFLVAIIATESRSALLAVVGSSFYIVVTLPKVRQMILKSFGSIKRKIAGFALVIVGVGLLVTALVLIRPASVFGRVGIYRSTMLMISDKPILGHGYNTFPATYPQYQADFLQSHPNYAIYSDDVYSSFNEFLQIWSEYGIVGLLITLALVVWIFSIPQRGKNIQIPLLAALIAIIISSLFSYPLRCYETIVYVIVIVGVLLSYDDKVFAKLPRGVIFIYIIPVSLFYYNYTRMVIDYIVGNKLWIQAKEVHNDINRQNELYEKAYVYFEDNTDFLFDYAISLFKAKRYDESINYCQSTLLYINTHDQYLLLGDSYKCSANYSQAEKAYCYANRIIPIRFMPLYKLMNLYKEMGDNERVMEVAEQIVDKDVKIESYIIEKIKQEAYQEMIELDRE